MEIIISLDNKKLKHYLGNRPWECHYLYPGRKEADVCQLLNKHRLKEIKVDDYDDSFKDGFVASYIDLIGQLGREYNSIYWWVTNTAAKNQYASNFFQNLFIFYTQDKTLDERHESDVLIINPPREICSSVAEYCRANSLGFKILASPSPNIFATMRGTLAYVLGRGYFIYLTWKKIYTSRKYLKKRFAHAVQRNGAYYILRSWFYLRTINDANEYRDSFFGILPDYLVKMGQRLMVVAGIIGDYEPAVRKIAGNNEHLIVPQEFFLRYADPIRVVIGVHFNKIRIMGKVDFHGLDVSGILKAEIDREFRGEQALDYIYHYHTKRLLDAVRVDTFTVTYENRPWERVCFETIREYSPQTYIIGYQHATLCPASIDMRLSEYEGDIVPTPDRINTTGRITRDFLERYGNYGPNRVKASCGLRFESFSGAELAPRKRSYRILVALRGIYSTATSLVSFVHRALKDSERYTVVIRPHPVLPYEQFKDGLDFAIASYKNWAISTSTSVKQDLLGADVLIYEGTALALEALAAGIPAIYIALNEIVSPDPLFQCEHFKYNVKREDELAKTIEAIYQLADDEYYRQQLMAVKYARDYIYDITDERLGEFIRK